MRRGRGRPRETMEQLVARASALPVPRLVPVSPPGLPRGLMHWMTIPEREFKGCFHASRVEALSLILMLEDRVPEPHNASYSIRDAILVILRLIGGNPTLDVLATDLDTSHSTIGRIIEGTLPSLAMRADELWGPKVIPIMLVSWHAIPGGNGLRGDQGLQSE